MRPDALLLASGLCTDAVVAPEAREALAAFAARFLACGGGVTLAEFAALSPESRQALADAREAEIDRWVSAFAGSIRESAEEEARVGAELAAGIMAREAAP